jgi:hypothetical protein
MRRAVLMAGLLLLAAPAAADMYPDASNATPNAMRNLGGPFVVEPGGAIQAALDAAAANGGGEVYVQKGGYTITSPLRVSSNTAIRCERGTTITATSVGWSDPSPDPDHGAKKAHIVNVNHGILSATSAPITDHDIGISGCGFAVAGTFMSDGAFHAIEIRKAKRIRVRDNTFMAGANGTAMIATEDTVVAGNSMGVVTTGATHSNTTLDGLGNTQGVAIGMPVFGAGIPDNTTVAAIVSPTAVTLSAAATATASGVQVIFGPAFNACWDHWEGARDLVVADNTCGTVLYGILVTGSDTGGTAVLTARNGNVYGNKIAIGPRAVGGAAGIWLNGLGLAGNGASNIAVSNNQISGGNSKLVCWKVSGGGSDNIISGNTCRDGGLSSVGASISADGGGTPTATILTNNVYSNINVASGEIAVLQLGGPKARSLAERVVGGSYPSLAYLSSTDNAVINIDGATGIGGRFNTSGAVRPSVVDADPSDGFPRFYYGLHAEDAVSIEDTRAIAVGVGGALNLRGQNSAGTRVAYGAINSYAIGGTPGTEAGNLIMKAMGGGALNEVARFTNDRALQLYGYLSVGTLATTLAQAPGEIGLARRTPAGDSAPGAAGGKLALVCGTTAGTAALKVYAGTSATPVTIIDNIGAGVTGC